MIVIVGPVLSYVQLNCVAAELSLPDASVNLLAGTSIVHAPSPLGVNVAVYTVVLLVTKLLIAPFPTVISVEAKFVVASLDVNVSDNVASFDVSPSDTSEAVIVIDGPVLSYVQLNCVAAELSLPDASVNLLAGTSIVHAPSPLGVNVAVYTVVLLSLIHI